MATHTGPLRRTAAALTTMLILVVLAPLPAGAAPERPTSELTATDLDAWLDGLVPALLEREAIPGAAISVVHEGEVLTQRGFGHADLGDQGREAVPMDPERTLLRVGSISKTPVAIAAMQLVERGELDLDEPVGPHLDLELETSYDRPITMRHLLTHTAGFEEVIRDVILPAPAPVPELREYLRTEMPAQIYAPGTVPAYSNYGYALAGYVVERISGQDVAQYLRSQVLEVAGATTATYAQPLPAEAAQRAARPYPSTHEEPIGFEIVAPSPAGSMSASAADMSSLMLALLEEEDSPLLEPASLETLQSPGLTEQQLGNLAAGPQMALGFFEEDRNGHRIIGHSGDTIHSHAAFQIYPEEATGVFIGLNGSGSSADSATVLRSALLDGFSDRYFPPTERSQQQPTDTAEQRAEAVAGQYVLARSGQSTFLRLYSLLTTAPVTAEGDRLLIPTVADASGTPIPLTETEPWVFEDEAGTHRVAVRADEDGRVEAIGLMPAVALLPAPAWTTPLLVTGLVSLAILVIAVIAWPVRAVVGRRLGSPLRLERTDRRLRWASLALAAVAVAATALWGLVAASLLGAAGTAPTALLRGAQVATLAGALGIVPATWRAVRTWARRSWLAAVLATLVTVAFAGVTAFALVGGLLLPDISY